MDLFKRKIRPKIQNLLPIYLIGRLNHAQKSIIQWASGDPSAQKEVDNLGRIRSAVRHQPELIPDPQILERINAAIVNERQESYPRRKPTLAWVVILLVAIIGLVLLWQAFPPGVVLKWSIQGGTPELFRVYRAEQNASSFPGDTFRLLEELPVESSITTYNFTDWIPSLGKEYVYRVEAVDSSGQISTGQNIVGRGIDTLPGQIILLFGALLILGILVQLAVTGWYRPSRDYRETVVV